MATDEQASMTPSSTPMSDEQEDELLMILEKYKEDIKFLHHQIRDQGLTPDEILAKEDTETNKAKAALLAWRDHHTKEAVEADENHGEGRGRTAVLTAMKEWADATESTYNRFIEDELRKVTTLSAPQQSTGGGDE